MILFGNHSPPIVNSDDDNECLLVRWTAWSLPHFCLLLGLVRPLNFAKTLNDFIFNYNQTLNYIMSNFLGLLKLKFVGEFYLCKKLLCDV